MRRSVRIFLCITLSLPLLSSAFAVPPLGAVVQTWHYDPATNIITLTIVNVSHKDITGYNLSIKETYADGHVNSHELLNDQVGVPTFLQEMQNVPNEADIRKRLGDGLFHPGESRKELIGVTPGLKDCEAVVDVVAYADGTAETNNDDGLQRLIDHRKADVASKQYANEVIKAALADPNDPNPAATAATKIQERITLWKAQPHKTLDLETGVLQGVVDELKRTSSRDALNQYVAKNEKRIATLSPHASLTKTGGPQ